MRGQAARPPEPEWSREMFSGFTLAQLSILHGRMDRALTDAHLAGLGWDMTDEISEIKNAVYARIRSLMAGDGPG